MMIDKIAGLKDCKFAKILKNILSSKYFSFVTAAFSLISYYLGLDVALFYYLAICGILMIFLLDDLTPTVSLLIFMGVSVSLKNTPTVTVTNSDYYGRPEVYIQLIVIAALFIGAAVYRLVKTIVKKNFKLTPVFYGTCGYAFILIINGLFSPDYNPKNLLFGFVIAISILGIYSALKDNINTDSDGFEKIAYAFLALSVVLIVELIVAYVTTEGLFEDGIINRSKLVFGWGAYNTFGLMLLICIPAVMFLAGRKRFGFVYTLYSFVLFVALFFSCSRQSMIGGVIIYLLCVILLLVKGKNRFANASVLSAAVAASVVLIGVYHEEVFTFFKVIFYNIIVDGELNGSGRTRLWREAIDYFIKNPVFGSGFFVNFDYPENALGFLPMMCHNTILQLLSACGIVGLTAYVLHRTLTVISFCKNVTAERTFIALSILCILILDVFDHHMFNIFPTFIYASLLAVLDKSEAKTAQ